TSFLLTLLVSVGALGAAYVAQFVFDLKPCELCLWQRWPYMALIVTSLVAVIWGSGLGTRVSGNVSPEVRGPRPVIFLALFILFFLTSAGLAFFHVGIEQHWWVLEKGCPVGELKGKTEAEILAELLATPLAECDKVAWKLLGFSITVWN